MQITKLLQNSDIWFQNYDFQVFLESHLSYLRDNYVKISQVVEPNIGAVYKGDFYGLLSYYKVPTDYHYINLRINGYENSTDYKGETMTIGLVSQDEVTLLRNIYRTVQK